MVVQVPVEADGVLPKQNVPRSVVPGVAQTMDIVNQLHEDNAVYQILAVAEQVQLHLLNFARVEKHVILLLIVVIQVLGDSQWNVEIRNANFL